MTLRAAVCLLVTLLFVQAAIGCAWWPWGPPAPPPDGPDFKRELPADFNAGAVEGLADIFYELVSNRRFNSIATFQDPALREFFLTRESFADYYADLAHQLDAAYFEASRPTRAAVEGLAVQGSDAVWIRVRFTGENGLPLRWWKTHLIRDDLWRYSEGRWWIIPGKL